MDHAIIIGAGIAGLLAASALSDRFDSVTVLERDLLPADPATRPGVPQGRHAHALAARGLIAVEQLLPGLRDELAAAGTPPVDFCGQTRLHLPAGAPPPVPSEILFQPVSRPLLEAVVRDKVTALSVRIRDRVAVTGLVADPAGQRVIGVHTLRRAGREPITHTLAADLVPSGWLAPGGWASVAPYGLIGAWTAAAGISMLRTPLPATRS